MMAKRKVRSGGKSTERQSVKVIVSHSGAMKKKHGTAGMKKIAAALTRLVTADRTRGVATTIVHVDVAVDMKGIGKPVKRASDRRGMKRALDEIFAALHPHYIVLLGAPDVIPHQRLKNPVFHRENDPDRNIDTDLPYACDSAYSTKIESFLGPTRVVGRLPDIQGGGNTSHLLALLDEAIKWKSLPSSKYGTHFSLSAEAWKKSTRLSIRKLFGSSAGVHISPPETTGQWTAAELKPLVHFINCHGATADPMFYGENENDPADQPIAHVASHLGKRAQRATVVAAECCYGAELYRPIGRAGAGICQSYMEEGAWGFFGSTTIAYGPEEGNDYADLLCGEFLKQVLAGASTGRAALMARQKYIGAGNVENGPHHQKTIAQFNLIGDPSVHPVKSGAAATIAAAPRSKSRGATASKVARPPVVSRANDRSRRRRKLAARGRTLARKARYTASVPDFEASNDIRAALTHVCQQHRFHRDSTRSFCVHGAGESHTVYHVMFPDRSDPVRPGTAAATIATGAQVSKSRATAAARLRRKKPAVRVHRVLIAREINGKIVGVDEIFRR